MSKLFIVPTPIGNLEDITLRALNILKEADLILAEDTRKTGILLNHYNISTRMASHHKFNEHKKVENIIRAISNGETMALVSDAGTPGISDPGYLLIRECIRQNIAVECLPGATSVIPAVVISGLPSDRFIFEGFLPHKKGRKKKLSELAAQPYTVVLFESPFRIIKTLEQMIDSFGPKRKIAVIRELTKIYEEATRGTLEEVIIELRNKTIKGEFVIVTEGKSQTN